MSSTAVDRFQWGSLRPTRVERSARVDQPTTFRKSLDDFMREQHTAKRAADARHRARERQADRAAHEALLIPLSDAWWREAERGVNPSFPAPWTLSTGTLRALNARLSGKVTKQPRKRKYVKSVRS